MFNGTYYPTLDAKNRFFLPAQYRDELGTSVVLFKSPDKEAPCLFLYTEERWAEISENFTKRLPNNRMGRALERRFTADSVSAEVDKSGRITVNQQLREFAGLEKELVVLGATNRIEIWSKSAWLEEEKAIAEISVEELEIEF